MNPEVDETLRLRAQTVADELLARIDGARAVLLATADGFALASAGEPRDTPQLAAMTSAIAAISQVVSQTSDLGEPQCVVVDASRGFLLVRSAQYRGTAVVINVMTTRQALLGMAMHVVNAAARELEL
ncbi:roadblock/LC7 domain-containing protein [Ideonella azotifigens]|uniref:Roadblock/LAMTOR2 domain-containing protein n=1 Tax=Ideonella azotifigens TaxID=513160 RepID=A0ABN1KBH2_9BURK|nr:roadblock/LC7 domain-containing protein [Ideonella azotifigens]MCD2344029.1 roadblock/LC7 domain-containing protein [Ideonella azotifigens]